MGFPCLLFQIEELTVLLISGDLPEELGHAGEAYHCISSSEKGADTAHHSNIGGHVESKCDRL